MKVKDILNESSLSRLFSKTQNHAVGAISAFRGELSKAENLKRTKQLSAYLRSRGYDITQIDGGFIENYGTPQQRDVSEKTLFVVNPAEGDDSGALEADLKRLGTAYDQDSILSYRFNGKPTYIGTTTRPDADLAKDDTYDLNKTQWGNPDGPYYSSVRGRKFAYVKEAVDVTAPNTVNGKIVAHLLVTEVEELLNQQN